MATIRETLQQTHGNLESVGIPDARLESEVMVMNVMRMPRQDLFSPTRKMASTPSRNGSWPRLWNAG